MDRIERIVYMEKALNEAAEAITGLSAALEKYGAVQERLQELSDYYGSALWRQDFDDDGAGKIPGHIKRGVLSEDAVYDLLTEAAELKAQMRRLGG